MPVTGIVELPASNIRFGNGVTREVGLDLAERKARRVMVLADPNLVDAYPVQAVCESLETAGISYLLFSAIEIEPTDASFQAAAAVAQSEMFDAFVAIGGGSTIDTAKAANLYSTWPAPFLDYVTKPHGRALPCPGPVKPLIAIPTTTGTGSETTAVSVFDFKDAKVKCVIGHRYLRPVLALLDPWNTRTLPSAVVASSGLDVFSHAIESLTAVPYTIREQPDRPSERPAYQGSNPISDVWALESLRLARRYFTRAVEDASDLEARGQMLLAAAFAGMGFGNAGVHLPHAMSYPVSSRKKNYWPEGYNVDHPLVPHGISVILTTPAVARFMAPVCPERLLWVAEALGVDVSGAAAADAGRIVGDEVIRYMQRFHVPSGLKAVGFERADIPALVEGTLPQERIVKICPRPASAADMEAIFEESLLNF
jgi:hydroxyacid-oxoacid transhydrogenase